MEVAAVQVMVSSFRDAPAFCVLRSMTLHLHYSLPSLCVICVCSWKCGEALGLIGDKYAYISEYLSLTALL